MYCVPQVFCDGCAGEGAGWWSHPVLDTSSLTGLPSPWWESGGKEAEASLGELGCRWPSKLWPRHGLLGGLQLEEGLASRKELPEDTG